MCLDIFFSRDILPRWDCSGHNVTVYGFTALGYHQKRLTARIRAQWYLLARGQDCNRTIYLPCHSIVQSSDGRTFCEAMQQSSMQHSWNEFEDPGFNTKFRCTKRSGACRGLSIPRWFYMISAPWPFVQLKRMLNHHAYTMGSSSSRSYRFIDDNIQSIYWRLDLIYSTSIVWKKKSYP